MSIVCKATGTKHTHETAVEVRDCYTTASKVGPRAATADRIDSAVRESAAQGEPQPTGGPLASEKQINFILNLCAERDVAQPDVALLRQLSRAEATKRISVLLETPKKVAPSNDTDASKPDVPAGHYAVETDGVTKFYRVDRPTEGKWKGYTFVKVQASDDYHRVNKFAAQAILAKIAEDVQGAMTLYGQRIGRCGHCNRTLTDEASRARGIGPICYGKMGW